MARRAIELILHVAACKHSTRNPATFSTYLAEGSTEDLKWAHEDTALFITHGFDAGYGSPPVQKDVVAKHYGRLSVRYRPTRWLAVEWQDAPLNNHDHYVYYCGPTAICLASESVWPRRELDAMMVKWKLKYL